MEGVIYILVGLWCCVSNYLHYTKTLFAQYCLSNARLVKCTTNYMALGIGLRGFPGRGSTYLALWREAG